jgi:hypothetical protein
VLLDTHSDKLASGTTQANVEGASIGGQTDGFDQTSGTVSTRYDTPVALAAAPTPPAGLVGTSVAPA